MFSSSCTVYGQPDELPVTEESPLKSAESPYGRTKQICESILNDVVASGAPLPPSSFAEVMQCDRERFNRFFHAMLGEGVYLAPSAYEAGFVSAAHAAAELDATFAAAAGAFKTLA